ncbi:MAG: guanylate kinase [Pseudomonadota bacterium]|nr:guanylate kinase [Gammaproteobacteria bacterium]MBU1559115.1 guanylate kinase [Gammaproteobacteria bacterium]MBU1628961.1 guanylate kinase [Gammaproteobacteria bacterium]MBU1926735.1 guanylate kinase [Gammaproteobacteria bacterium]MBU2546445.1 guanylate kinase [Gammaproteobacteria bacterium]
MAGILYVISAPSGTGKTSLVDALLQSVPNLQFSVSYTTRAKRAQEVHGKHYYFVSQTQFDEMVERGDFFEYATVFGNGYGTSKAVVQELMSDGHDVVLEIDWQGAQRVRELMKEECVSIFILPPSKEILKKRIVDRGQDHLEIIQRRLSEAELEMQHYKEFDYLVVNDFFEEAVHQLQSIIYAERCRLSRQEQQLASLIKSLQGCL